MNPGLLHLGPDTERLKHVHVREAVVPNGRESGPQGTCGNVRTQVWLSQAAGEEAMVLALVVLLGGGRDAANILQRTGCPHTKELPAPPVPRWGRPGPWDKLQTPVFLPRLQ